MSQQIRQLQSPNGDVFLIKTEPIIIQEGSNFLVKDDFLEITAWGESKEQAMEAFNFSVEAVFQNYILEDDGNLTEKAKAYKDKISTVITGVYLNSEE